VDETIQPYPLGANAGKSCDWCGEPASCSVPAFSDYRLDEVVSGECLVPACETHGRAVMLRVGAPRELRPAWIEGRMWPLCHFCGKTLDNKAFGGRTVFVQPLGLKFSVGAHESCAVTNGAAIEGEV
jgi:hypothetical protein